MKARLLTLTLCTLVVSLALISTWQVPPVRGSYVYVASASGRLASLWGTRVGPFLSIPSEIPAQAGQTVFVPINFTANGHSISSLVFSVDYDATWLSFDSTDGDEDGIPDGVTLNLPGAFNASVTFDGDDTDGELDFFIADVSPPLAALSDGAIITLTLGVGSPSSTTEAAVNFSQEPTTSFGDTSGQSVPGATEDGSVLITTPALGIPSEIEAQAGQSISVPISFTANGHRISSLVFSMDYDETWLSFDPTDSDGDDILDAVTFNLPSAFDASVTFDGDDTDGELDFFIADLSSPLAAFSDGTVVSLTLSVGSPFSATVARVNFSQAPAASFGSTSGHSVPGTADGGALFIVPFPDFNGDGRISAVDVQTVAGVWHTYDPSYDQDGDGMITIVDIMLVVVRWGERCPGCTPVFDIAGTVFYDGNGNCDADPGEARFSNVDVLLVDPGPDGIAGGGDDVVIDTTVTDTNGDFRFEAVEEKDYFLRVPEAAGFPDTPVFTLNAPYDGTTADAYGNPEQPNFYTDGAVGLWMEPGCRLVNGPADP